MYVLLIWSSLFISYIRWGWSYLFTTFDLHLFVEHDWFIIFLRYFLIDLIKLDLLIRYLVAKFWFLNLSAHWPNFLWPLSIANDRLIDCRRLYIWYCEWPHWNLFWHLKLLLTQICECSIYSLHLMSSIPWLYLL